MSALSLSLDSPDLAEHYERASVDRQFRVGKLLVERLAIGAGERVLDVGSGTGLLAEYVANIVGSAGAVHAIDPLPLRIEIAKRKAKPNLSFAVDDAYQLDTLADASFDVVYLNAVFHWFPDKLPPLRNFHRLLKPQGRLGISTGSKDHPHRIHEIQQQVLARDPYRQFLKPKMGLPERVSSSELKHLLDQTGFRVRSLTTEPHVTYHATPQAAIEHSQASSFGNLLGHLPTALRDAANRDICLELEQFRTTEGIRQDGARLVAVAIKN